MDYAFAIVIIHLILSWNISYICFSMSDRLFPSNLSLFLD